MLTFKKFLSEAVVKNWDSEQVDIDNAIKFMNKYCKDGLKALSNGGLLYRGFGGGGSAGVAASSFRIMVPSTGVRTSRDTNNVYQLMMDNSTALAEYPKRSNSFICSSSPGTADAYGTPFVVIPVDGSPIGLSPTADIFAVKVNTRLLKIDLQDMAAIDSFFNLAGLKSSSSYKNFDDFNEVLAKWNPEMLTFFWSSTASALDQQGYDDYLTLLTKNEEPTKDDIRDLDDFDRIVDAGNPGYDTPEMKSADAKKIQSFIDAGKIKLSGAAKTFHDLISSAPTDKRATALASYLMNEGSLKTKLVQFGEPLPRDRECWVSAKCMVIPFAQFAYIILQLKKLGHPIHSSTMSGMSYYIQQAKKKK